MSGYTDHVFHQRGFDPDAAFLEKFFTPNAPSQKVREALDGVGQ